jgi:hypothetical protein
MRPRGVHPALLASALEMTSPVQCGRCGGIYDLGTVEIVDRYLDCSAWRAPCCKAYVDSRCEDAPGWTSQIDYVKIDKSEIMDSAFIYMWDI